MSHGQAVESVLHALSGAHADVDLYRRIQAAEDPTTIIDPSFHVAPGVILGNVSHIGEGVRVEAATVIGDNVTIGDIVSIESGVVVCNEVTLTSRLAIYPGVMLGSQVQVEPLERETHSFARTIKNNVVVGSGVVLPSEVQLGAAAVIPVTEAIGEVGTYGEHHRMVTAYGTMAGEPRYSAGCQYGITEEAFRNRIANSVQTEPSSAQDYANHFDEIVALGAQVQTAFDDNMAAAKDLVVWQRELSELLPLGRYGRITGNY